ncbi:zinc ribbon domain-containing protein [Pseudomonas fulva]|nr:zinc ribbon domain-containing protein [Pseudomonas fulva]MBF8779095.1 zinc ribbon domain-containing protein [Pseudomonas fulva]
MEVVGMLLVLAVTALVWWGSVKKLRQEGKGAFTRHVLGCISGLVVGFLVMLVWAILVHDGNKPSTPTHAESTATQAEPAFEVSDTKAVESPITYTITKDDYRSGGSILRKVEAMLPRRLSEQELKEVAYAIRDDYKTKLPHTFIGFRVEGQTADTYWASAKFQPDYEASIIGLKASDYQQLANTDLSQYPTMISSWLSDGMIGELMVLYKVKNTYKLDRIFTDGKRTETYLAKDLDGQRLRLQQPDDENGEYYVLLPNGDLEGWSSNGKYAHLPQFKAPPARD